MNMKKHMARMARVGVAAKYGTMISTPIRQSMVSAKLMEARRSRRVETRPALTRDISSAVSGTPP